VHSFPWPLSPNEQIQYDKIKEMSRETVTRSDDERFMGTFLLGHSSSIVDITLLETKKGRFLASVDRDEHVRISVFPETYIIYAMGLGHSAFVSAVLAVNECVISGGGDRKVIMWDIDGNQLDEYISVHGSCVRCIKRWKEEIVVLLEGYASDGFD
jgi:WD40 repeat protein